MMPLAAEHFVRALGWTWYILFYFFLAGLSGGSYVIATLLRLYGNRSDEPTARLGYYIAFPMSLVCGILLTMDLRQPLRFWHMLVNTTPGQEAPIFKSWSPMSVGSWALAVFGVFTAVSFLEVLIRDRVIRTAISDRAVRLLDGAPGKVWTVVGAVLGLFIASYTGVLLSVSNQPVWSDTWALGGLFLASGLCGAAALITLLMRYRPEAAHSLDRLRIADGYFSILELILLVAFLATVVIAGGADRILPWFPLWIIALLGIGASLYGFRRPVRVSAGAQTAAVTAVAAEATVVAVLVLVAVLALRAAVIFSAQ